MTTADPPTTERSRQVQLLVGGAAIQTTGKVLTLLVQVVSLVIVTRFLGRGGFGDLAAGLAVGGILEAVGEFGLTATLVMRLGEGHRPASILRSGVRASAVAALIGLAVTLPIGLGVLGSSERFAYVVLLPSSLITLLTVSCLAYWQYELAFVRIARTTVAAQCVGALALAAGLLFLDHAGEHTKLLLVGGSQVLAGVVVLLALWPRHLSIAASSSDDHTTGDARPEMPDPERVGTASILVSALPLGIATSISLLHVRADQVVLAAMGYRSTLGDYAIAYRALEAIVSGIATMSVVAFSLMARSHPDARAQQSRTSTAVLVAAGAAGAFAFALLAPVVIPVLGGHGFGGAVRYCRLLAPVVVMAVGNTMAGRVLIAERRAWLLITTSVSALTVNVALNLLLIPHLGGAGAATATVVSEGLGTIAVTLLASRMQPGSQPLTIIGVALAGSTASLLCWAWLGHSGLVISTVLGVATLATVTGLAWRIVKPTIAEPAAPAG